MRENGMPFVADMIRAVRERRKLQTRRIVNIPAGCEYDGYDPNTFDVLCSSPTSPTGSVRVRNRYGVAGDRVWARETWALIKQTPKGFDALCGKVTREEADGWTLTYRADTGLPAGVWRPSILMPRWASRITLELTRVRVERVQDISEADAIAEGVFPIPDNTGTYRYDAGTIDQPFRRQFATLWDYINGKRGLGWDANPVVRAYDFRVIEVDGQAVAA